MRGFLLVFLTAALCLAQTPLFSGSAEVDAAITQAIREDKLPGAVLIVGHEGRVIYRKAYGNRAVEPRREAMTVDAIFDLASLTKILATTSAAMKLNEEGKLGIDDPVTKYLPEFQGGHSDITIRDLMTHFSGLRPDLDLEPEWSGYTTGIQKALIDKPANPRGAKFVYSDINFILMGEIIRRLSGQMENDYVRKILIEPLGLRETSYWPVSAGPPSGLLARIAPTEKQKDGTILRGVVHDPTARFMGGVAGHAGLFSTADDVARFCQMILDGGKAPDGKQVFRAETVARFTRNAAETGQPVKRGLGWDIESPYSRPRGELFPVGSFGHTGFTGTSIWIDPATRTYVVLMANAVHPRQRPAITPLRAEIATIVAKSVGYGKAAGVLTGLDVLERQNFAPLKGKTVGLITNQTGLDRLGQRGVDQMLGGGVEVVALFSPEHGFGGVEDRPDLEDAVDGKTGLKVHSLYGKNRRPTPEMLRGLQALVFDIQDVGVRFYTYETTMIYAMEEAAKAGVPFYVLDRPDPLTGEHVEGPILDAERLSFTGAFPLPLRHGMTLGELAQLVNGEKHFGADLHVIAMQGWKRRQWFDTTGLTWVSPSPNLRSLDAAMLYPGLALLEGLTNYSVGRGTDAPFEQIGAEWIDPNVLAAKLRSREIPGVEFSPVKFRPASSNLEGKEVAGLRFRITDRERFSAAKLGLELAASLEEAFAGKINWSSALSLIGNTEVVEGLRTHANAVSLSGKGIADFLKVRQRYLIYQ